MKQPLPKLLLINFALGLLGLLAVDLLFLDQRLPIHKTHRYLADADVVVSREQLDLVRTYKITPKFAGMYRGRRNKPHTA